MPKDDYNKVVCTILIYLYSRLKGKNEEAPESFLQPYTKAFPIKEDYFYFVLQKMQEQNLIEGLVFVKAWGGDIINIKGISEIRITDEGIQHLSHNKTMRTTLEYFRDNAVSLPGMVSTVVGILSQ